MNGVTKGEVSKNEITFSNWWLRRHRQRNSLSNRYLQVEGINEVFVQVLLMTHDVRRKMWRRSPTVRYERLMNGFVVDIRKRTFFKFSFLFIFFFIFSHAMLFTGYFWEIYFFFFQTFSCSFLTFSTPEKFYFFFFLFPCSIALVGLFVCLFVSFFRSFVSFFIFFTFFFIVNFTLIALRFFSFFYFTFVVLLCSVFFFFCKVTARSDSAIKRIFFYSCCVPFSRAI